MILGRIKKERSFTVEAIPRNFAWIVGTRESWYKVGTGTKK